MAAFTQGSLGAQGLPVLAGAVKELHGLCFCQSSHYRSFHSLTVCFSTGTPHRTADVTVLVNTGSLRESELRRSVVEEAPRRRC